MSGRSTIPHFSGGLFVCFLWRCGPTRVMASSFLRFLDHTQRRITVGRTPLDETSARRRDLYLTTHNTHNRQTSMPPVGFEPTISASERPQTYALDRTATGTGHFSGGTGVKHRDVSRDDLPAEFRTRHRLNLRQKQFRLRKICSI